MSLPIQPIAAELCVAPQLGPQDMSQVAAEGFKSVINNRPDLEGGSEQPLSAAIEAACRAAGLEYRHLPVSGAYQSPEQIAAFGELLQSLPRPILAFCRSGARSTRLYQASQT